MVPDFWLILIVITASGFIMEVVDAAMGMGYGTVLTLILLLMGFDPLQIVPALLISQLVGGLLASFFHHKYKNADFAIGGEHLRVAIILGVLSAAGAIASVFVAVSQFKLYVSLYIGVLATIMGLVLFVTRDRKYNFSWARMMIVGLFAAFNKGLSGGGYGPVVTVGQIVSGVAENSAVSITSLSEVLVSFTAVSTYIVCGGTVDWILTGCFVIGASLSAPVAAAIVRRTKGRKLKMLISAATLILGMATILRALCLMPW